MDIYFTTIHYQLIQFTNTSLYSNDYVPPFPFKSFIQFKTSTQSLTSKLMIVLMKQIKVLTAAQRIAILRPIIFDIGLIDEWAIVCTIINVTHIDVDFVRFI